MQFCQSVEKYQRNKASKSYNVTEHIKSENNVNLRVISFLKAFVEELLICNINRVKWINENMEELPKYAIDMTSSGILHSSNIQQLIAFNDDNDTEFTFHWTHLKLPECNEISLPKSSVILKLRTNLYATEGNGKNLNTLWGG